MSLKDHVIRTFIIEESQLVVNLKGSIICLVWSRETDEKKSSMVYTSSCKTSLCMSVDLHLKHYCVESASSPTSIGKTG